MDNSGSARLKVPGFGGIPVDFQFPCEDRFAHGFNEWIQVPAVTVRELAMVAAINAMTDKRQWHIDAFDEQVVASWREEAFSASPFISDKAWDWCLHEVRAKAKEFLDRQYIRVHDTGSCICKSDALISDSPAADLRSQIGLLFEESRDSRKPDSEDGMQKSVDPDLFPLVYGKSPVLMNSSKTELHNLFEDYEFAQTAPSYFDPRVDSVKIEGYIQGGRADGWSNHWNEFKSKKDNYFWSHNHQRLPCEVRFKSKSGTAIQIFSYINDLHPSHQKLYGSLAGLISSAIKPWNDCLIQGQKHWKDAYGHLDLFNQKQRGPVPLRIITYGVESDFELLGWTDAFITHGQHYRNSLRDYPRHKNDEKPIANDVEHRIHSQLESCSWDAFLEWSKAMPEPSPELWIKAKQYLELPEPGPKENTSLPDEWKGNVWSLLKDKIKRLQSLRHPEPGAAVSYQDWRSEVQVERAVVEMVKHRYGYDGPAPTDPGHDSYSVRLETELREEGLQVMVTISGVELDQERPKYEAGTGIRKVS